MQQTAQHSKPREAARFAHPRRNVGVLGIEPGMVIADFGAGSGAYTLAIAERLANMGHVYAIDIQKDLLRRIHTEAHKHGYKNVEVLWSDLEKEHASKLAAHSVDVVLISNLLFQLDDKSAVVHEAGRILKPAGRLIIIDWSDSFGGMGPIKKQVVTKVQALELVSRAHFELVKEFEAGAHHYGLILRPTPKQ